MTALWFVLGFAALAGAVALLYVDYQRRNRSGRAREVWAQAHGYEFSLEDRTLAGRFHRGVFAQPDAFSARDVVSGDARGERFVLFDIADVATVIAVARPVGSRVDLDLRRTTSAPPHEADLHLLGALGPRVAFSNEPDLARRAIDQRMVAFASAAPDALGVLWSEGAWALGSIPLTSTETDWDAAVDAVAKFAGLLRVLPPSADPAPAQVEADPLTP